MTSSTSHQPLFIVGPLRAGTTFLRLIVGMHPETHIFGEFEEAVHLLEDEGWPAVDTYKARLATHRAFLGKRLEIDPKISNYRDLVLDFWRQLTQERPERVVGASIHSRFDRCPDLWPDAKYVHILRDPRDVARSCIGMGWVANVYFGVDYWLKAEKTWDRLVERTSAEQRLEVRYERLVMEPESVLRQICEFLDLPYDPVLLDYPKHSTYGPPDPKLVEQWKRKLSQREIALVEGKACELMKARGYEPVTACNAPGEAERILLFLQNRVGRASAGIKRYGLPLWVQGRVAKLFPGTRFSHATKLKINEVTGQHLR